MNAQEIAETLINGNISVAREAIVKGRTQTEAAVMALDVLAEMYWSADPTPSQTIARLRRCLNGGS